MTGRAQGGRPRSALLGLCLALAAAPAAAGEPRVVLLAPGADAALLGPVTVAFRLEGASDASVAGARVILDGLEAGAFAGPPWQLTVDAGASLQPRRLDVVVWLKDGQRLRTGFTSRRLAGTEVEVRLVNLGATVTDRSGRALTDLKAEDFRVFDAGAPVPLSHWNAAPGPLSVALVLDASLTMRGDKMTEAKAAAAAFVKELTAEDELMLLAFSDDVRVWAPFSDDHGSLLKQIEQLEAAGGTALYDAVFAAAVQLRDAGPERRKVLVLLSDGRDEAANGLEPGSFHTLDEAIRQAHLADAMVFSLGLGAILDRETDFAGRMTTAEVLERLARSTGGVFERVTRSSRLSSAFRDVVDDLRHQYSLAYRPPDVRPGETWRAIEVRVARPGAKVRAREGYFVN